MGSDTGDVHALRGGHPGRHRPRPSPSPPGRGAEGMIILAWVVAVLFGAAPRALAQFPPEDGVEQIEARIRRQREENLRAVQSLIGRLTSQFDEQRAGLAKDEARLRALGSPGSHDPHFDLPALEAQFEGRLALAPPRPSPGIPQPRKLEIAPEIPPLPSGPFSPFDLDLPDSEMKARHKVLLEVRSLEERIKERRIAIRQIASELVRARALLRDLGDDGVPPPPALGPAKSEPGGKEAPLKPEGIGRRADRMSDSQAARRERPTSGL
jgi:hypothetical protein